MMGLCRNFTSSREMGGLFSGYELSRYLEEDGGNLFLYSHQNELPGL